MPSITREAWEAKGRELFGEDQDNWIFRCPRCGKELSAAGVRLEFASELPVLRVQKFRIEAECIGRHLPRHGCDWAAYGLFRGPLIVVDGENSYATFDFAGKPFTEKKGA